MEGMDEKQIRHEMLRRAIQVGMEAGRNCGNGQPLFKCPQDVQDKAWKLVGTATDKLLTEIESL